MQKNQQNLWIVLNGQFSTFVSFAPKCEPKRTRCQLNFFPLILQILDFFKARPYINRPRFSIQKLLGNAYSCHIETSVSEGRSWPLAFAADWILMSCKLFEGSTLSSCLALWHICKSVYHLGMCFTAWRFFSSSFGVKQTKALCSPTPNPQTEVIPKPVMPGVK